MENRERTCLLHCATSLQKHTKKFIRGSFQHQHTQLCKQYKDSKIMDEAETRYLAIRSWWLSSGAADEEALHHLDHWLAFWHFRYRQWGGFMQMIREGVLFINFVLVFVYFLNNCGSICGHCTFKMLLGLYKIMSIGIHRVGEMII